MKKRLRKKLHKGEFKELGFSFDAKFKTDTDLKIVEEWLQELAVLLHERGWEMGGGWNSDVCVGFITRERGSVTSEEREMMKNSPIGFLFLLKYYTFVSHYPGSLFPGMCLNERED